MAEIQVVKRRTFWRTKRVSKDMVGGLGLFGLVVGVVVMLGLADSGSENLPMAPLAVPFALMILFGAIHYAREHRLFGLQPNAGRAVAEEVDAATEARVASRLRATRP